MKHEDTFYNVQILLNVVFVILSLFGLFGFMDDFKTIMLEFVVVILKQDLIRSEVKATLKAIEKQRIIIK